LHEETRAAAQDSAHEHHAAAASPAHRRFFGRRKGRKLSKHQSSLLAEKLAETGVDLTNAPASPDELRSLFKAPINVVWLEIGFGAGEHLVWQAEHNPEVGVIGAEPFINGVAAALSAIEEKALERRVLLHAEDVMFLLDWLPAASISRGFMLFPDPWPKKRHRSRRLFNPAMLDKITRVLGEAGEFRFASDIADYAEAALELVKAHPAFEICEVFTSANRSAVADWPVTRYETKANEAGRSSTFLIFRKKALSPAS
jgi:tRNA (guanine-N7-)-methyltransferase